MKCNMMMSSTRSHPMVYWCFLFLMFVKVTSALPVSSLGDKIARSSRSSSGRAFYGFGRQCRARLWYSNDDHNDGGVDNDDDDELIFPESQMSKLNERILFQQNRLKEREQRIARNWQEGNWSVRGFCLDDSDAKEAVTEFIGKDDAGCSAKKPIHISALSVTDLDFGVAVGRTNGSVCIVRIGGEYMAKFSSVPKLTLVEQSKSSDGFAESDVTIPTAKLTSELVRDKNVNEDFLLDSLSGKENKPRQENLDEEITAPDPFEILLQFDAHDDRISVLLYDNMRKLFTCGDSDYLVKEWEIPRLAPAGRQVRRSSVTETVNCLRTYKLHTDKIIDVKKVNSSYLEGDVLLTFSYDGSFALWNHETGDLIKQIKVLLSDSPDPILSASIDEVEGLIFIGTKSGFVEGYVMDEIIENAKNLSDITPKCRFKATSDGAVSALHALSLDFGKGTRLRRNLSAKDIYTCGLLTGDSKGVVKRWEVMGRKAGDGRFPRFEHWPRMETQRFKKHAHIFKGHSDEVTNVLGTPTNIISTSLDGSLKVWSPASGDSALYSMESFKDISSICCIGSLLITDGMKNYVCLHDFDSVEDIHEDRSIDMDLFD